jgi:hypothetical protein
MLFDPVTAPEMKKKRTSKKPLELVKFGKYTKKAKNAVSRRKK